MTDKWDNLRLVCKLKRENLELYRYVLRHCKSIEEELSKISNIFSEYTDHSSPHSYKVLMLGDKLAGENNDLSVWEIAIFVLSAYHHDIGMYLEQPELDELLGSSEFKKLSPYLYDNIVSMNQLRNCSNKILENFIRLEFIRKVHGKQSYCRIKKKYHLDNEASFFDQNIYLWEAVALVCKSHCMEIKALKNPPYDTEYLIGTGITVNILFISCLLRLADICHLSRDRALPYIRKSKEFYSEKSQKIWKTYGDVADTTPSKEGECIKVSASCTDYRIHRALLEIAKTIEAELVQEHKLLFEKKSKYRFPWKFVDTTNIIEAPLATYSYTGDHFKLDFDKITELLMGSRLYRNDFFSLRECIQNSLDAVTVFKQKVKSAHSYIIICYNEGDNDSTAKLDIFDSGTGMDRDICSNYLLSIGSRSFWFSERSYEDWGAIKKDSPIIASHGIGFLSNFLIADKIEVFSKYHKSLEPVHMEIDGFKTGVIFRKTQISEFPKLDTIEAPYSLPWETGHGTCIRLHLRKRFPAPEFLHFLMTHIPRISTPLFFISRGEIIELPHMWQFNSYTGFDRFSYREMKELLNDNSLNKIQKELYRPPTRDFYENPPNDLALDPEIFIHQGLKGKVLLNYEGNIHSWNIRITQNGILINDGNEFFLKSKTLNVDSERRYIPFGFDIDVSGKFCFELDAERTRIIDNQRNRKIRNSIVKLLIKEYFEMVSKIQSTLYFPCGGTYYHGADSIFKDDQPFHICFHKDLQKFLSPKNLKNLKFDGYEEFLYKSKLYASIAEYRNYPLSVEDIKKDYKSYSLFIPVIIDDHYDEDVRSLTQWFENKKSDKLTILSKTEKIVVLPGYPDTYILPLILCFDFEIEKTDAFNTLLKMKPMDAKKMDFKRFKSIEKLFEISPDFNKILSIYDSEQNLSLSSKKKLRKILIYKKDPWD